MERAATRQRTWMGWALALLLAAPLAAAQPPASPEGAETPAGETRTDWTHLGLVRVRDLTPFGILRLDFIPAHSVTATTGTWALEADLSYQNTYVLSDNVAEYLEARGGGERVELTSGDVDAIRSLGEDAYLVDLELGLLDLTAHYRFTPHWGGYVTVPVLFFQGGFLDSAIEGFHERSGFSTANRDLTPRNRFQVVIATGDGELAVLDPPSDGVGDPVLGMRYSLFPQPERWNLLIEGAVKVAVLGARPFLSSGRNDVGVQVSLQRFFRRNALYLTASAVYVNGSSDRLTPDLEGWIPTSLVGWETKLSRRVNAVLQVYASRSVIQSSTLDELSANKYFATLGLQTHRGAWLYQAAVTENLANFNNTPDVGVSLSVAKVGSRR